MNKINAIRKIRQKLKQGKPSVGSWMHIAHASVAEIMGAAGYDWVAVDMEHGSVDISELPDLFRALELNSTLPLVRLGQGDPKECKQALDAGAGGVIVPMVETAEQLISVRNACCWPPAGNRGVGFSRANLFGKNFETYRIEAQAPILVAMIENFRAIENLEAILRVEGLDAILIGPYDLSASLNKTGKFKDKTYKSNVKKVCKLCRQRKIPFGVHVIDPDSKIVYQQIEKGYQFIPFSIDAVILIRSAANPLNKD
jgi:2-dehydro-3-deoxyglucarate aldolase